METVLITGGSGLIGQQLSEVLKKNNFSVRHLSRKCKGSEKYPTFIWDLSRNYIDPKAFENVDHIIHLAGENVASGRWTNARKNQIFSSRIHTANLILSSIGNKRLKSFISASGISYYGTKTTETIFKESAKAGTDFLAEISVKWETAAFEFNTVVDRVVALRTGVVLSAKGGALAKISKPIKMGFGSALGSGKQFIPWIHIEDMCNMYLKALQDSTMKGSFNAVASEHITNLEFTKAIAKTLNKKLWAPKVPAFLLKSLLGEMALIVLQGSRIDNTKIKNQDFVFKYDKLDKALEALLKK